MALECQTRICFRHALAIINHLNGGSTCLFHDYIYAVGSSINSIFQQFLDNRRWTLDDFTRGNLVCHRIR